MIHTVRTISTHDLEMLLAEFNALPVISAPTAHLIETIQVVLLERELDRLAAADLLSR